MTAAEATIRAAGALVIMRSGCAYTVPPGRSARAWELHPTCDAVTRFYGAMQLLRQTDGQRIGAGLLVAKR